MYHMCTCTLAGWLISSVREHFARVIKNAIFSVSPFHSVIQWSNIGIKTILKNNWSIQQLAGLHSNRPKEPFSGEVRGQRGRGLQGGISVLLPWSVELESGRDAWSCPRCWTQAVPELPGSGNECRLEGLADCLGSCAYSRVLDYYICLLSRAPNPLYNSGSNPQVPSPLLALSGGCLRPGEHILTSYFVIFSFFFFFLFFFVRTLP